MRPVRERGHAKLADHLRFTGLGNHAEGDVDGVAVSLRSRITRGERRVGVRVAFDQAHDLLLTIGLGADDGPPKRVPIPTGIADFDGWVVISGRGEVARAVALLGPEMRNRLRGLTSDARTDRALRVTIDDFAVETFLSTSLSTAEQESLVHETIALRDAVARATRDVPVAAQFVPAAAAFEAFARELRVEVTTCPFGLRGTVDECSIDVFRFLPGGPKSDMMLIRVGFPTPLRADILLNSHLRRSFWARVRSVGAALFALGPRPGWFSFGKRFKVTRGDPSELVRALATRGALATLAGAETTSFLNVSRTHLVTGVRVGDPHAPPDLVSRIRSLASVARAVHAAASRDGTPKRGGPYR